MPAFHALATENDAIKWDFFVRHYADDVQQRKDLKYVEHYHGQRVDGIWYPRAGALGGCTAHNAMIFVYPHNTDWNQLADLTGDASWRADHMRSYFERLEDCRHRGFQRFLGRLGANPTRHGWGGWLSTEKAQPEDAIADPQIRAALTAAIGSQLKELGFPSFERLESLGDPNDWRRVKAHEVGACYVPLTTRDLRRMGTRERLLSVKRRHANRLRIETDALVSRVLFDGSRAIGVEYLKGAHLYSADPRSTGAAGTREPPMPPARSSWPAALSTRHSCSCCRASDRATCSTRTRSTSMWSWPASERTFRIDTKWPSSTARSESGAR